MKLSKNYFYISYHKKYLTFKYHKKEYYVAEVI